MKIIAGTNLEVFFLSMVTFMFYFLGCQVAIFMEKQRAKKLYTGGSTNKWFLIYISFIHDFT